MAEFEPSPCPVLDLGVRLPANDSRDPWRRMPRLFQVARGVFGAGMYAHDGKTRQRMEARIGHYCKCTRETHGACTLRRAALCQEALAETIQRAAFAENGQEHAAMQAGITRLLRDERHHERLKATEVMAGRDVAMAVRMPPITLKEVPDA